MTSFEPPRPAEASKRSPLQQLKGYLHSGLSMFREGSYAFTGISKNKTPKVPGLPEVVNVSVREPAAIREMLVTRPQDFPKGRLVDQLLRKLTGYSIFVSNGEDWQRQRRIIDQAFTHAGVRVVFPLMQQAAIASLDRMRTSVGADLDADLEMTHFAGDVIFRTIYSEAMTAEQAKAIFAAFDTFQAIAFRQGMLGSLGIPIGLLPSRFAAHRSARIIRRELDAPLQRRLRASEAGQNVPDNDILSALLAAEDPATGSRFVGTELLDQIAMLFLAGHETSAAALGWTLYLLSHDQTVQQNLRDEVADVLGDRDPEFSDMKKLERTRNVFREAMRLYPPVAFLSRDVRQDDSLAGHALPQGSAAVIPMWLMHRHHAHWQDPHAFNPDRFASKDHQHAIRHAYMPFSMGARVCVGAAFALQEATLILTQIVRAFRILPVAGHVPEPVSRLTVRSANGIKIRLEPLR